MKLRIRSASSSILRDIDAYLEKQYARAYKDWQHKQKVAHKLYAKLEKDFVAYLTNPEHGHTKREARAIMYSMFLSDIPKHYNFDLDEVQVNEVAKWQDAAEQAKHVTEVIQKMRGIIS